MNSVQLTLAAGIVIPAVIAATFIVTPSEKQRMEEVALAQKQAALQRRAAEEDPQSFVLQPFYVPGGALIFEVEAKGMNGLSTLCSNLPIVHDAIITQLDEDQMLYSRGPNKAYKPNGERFRRAINSGFNRPHVLGIDVTYQPNTTISLAGKRKVGSSTRCLTLQKASRSYSGG